MESGRYPLVTRAWLDAREPHAADRAERSFRHGLDRLLGRLCDEHAPGQGGVVILIEYSSTPVQTRSAAIGRQSSPRGGTGADQRGESVELPSRRCDSAVFGGKDALS
jgi:hypothetical protein